MNDTMIKSQTHHDKAFGHSGEKGHYCDCNDGLWVCKDCEEFKTCTCFHPKPFACAPLEPTERVTLGFRPWYTN